MVFEPVLLTPSELDPLLDPDHPDYGFAIDHWVDPPPYVAPDGVDIEVISRRLANANAFQQAGSPVAWYRYITLGYYVYDDCAEFESFWRQFVSKQTLCMKMVWFNFLYHVDRKLDIPIKLQTWATEVARPHLSQLDPSFLRIDTKTTTWKKLLNNALKMDGEEQDERPWTLVNSTPKATGSKSKRANPSPFRLSDTRISPPPTNRPALDSSSFKLSSLRSASTSTKNTTKSLVASAGPTPSVPPSKGWPLPSAPPRDCNDHFSDTFDSKMPASPTPVNVSTNDGTHRLTFRWKPTENYQLLAENPVEWLTGFLDILKNLFSDRDGAFYRWESEDLSQHCSISDLTPHELRDYISPKITSMDTLSTFVFGIRFRFSAKSPLSWRNNPQTKKTLQEYGLGLSLSNSICSSGRLVIAGYILFKAPYTTHRVRYLQSIRSHLPDNAPFFDILLFKRTPTDDKIHHLAVQCGENHVRTLTSVLSAYLTGRGTAFFLSRLAFAKLTNDQIRKYFDMHLSYISSLRSIKLSPGISNLDVARRESHPDGTYTERTPREWATTLTLADGHTPARCDVTNGSSDFQTYLLVPTEHYAEILTAVRAYRFRLNILGERETRFRDSLSPPTEIEVDLSTQDNLSYLEALSASWKPAAAASADNDASSGTSQNTQRRSPPRKGFSSRASRSFARKPPVDNDHDFLNGRSQTPKSPTTSKPASTRNPQSDDHSLRSAGSASLATVLSRLDAMDKELQSQKQTFEDFAAKTNDQFSQQNTRLQKVDKLDGMIIKCMVDHQAESLSAMQTKFDGMMAQLMASLSPGIAPSPSSRRPHPSTYNDHQENHTARASVVDSPGLVHEHSNPTQSSMSVASGSSGSSSHLHPPRNKKSRSIRTDLEQLSIASAQASDSEFSDLGGDILYSSPVHAVHPGDPPAEEPTDMQTEVSQTSNTKAHTDSTTQNTYQCESDGGDSS